MMHRQHRKWIKDMETESPCFCYKHPCSVPDWVVMPECCKYDGILKHTAYFYFRETSGVHSSDLNLANPTQGKHDTFDDALRMIVNVYLETGLRCRAQAFVDLAWHLGGYRKGGRQDMSHLKIHLSFNHAYNIYYPLVD